MIKKQIFKKRIAENGEFARKQRNESVLILRKTKKDYLTNLNKKRITRNNIFGKMFNH